MKSGSDVFNRFDLALASASSSSASSSSLTAAAIASSASLLRRWAAVTLTAVVGFFVAVVTREVLVDFDARAARGFVATTEADALGRALKARDGTGTSSSRFIASSSSCCCLLLLLSYSKSSSSLLISLLTTSSSLCAMPPVDDRVPILRRVVVVVGTTCFETVGLGLLEVDAFAVPFVTSANAGRLRAIPEAFASDVPAALAD
jgi:hypothetical protein